MDFNATIDIILKDLRETREIIDDLKNYNGVPLLQVELAKSKCKSAEEVILLLKTTGLPHDQEQKEKKESDAPQPETQNGPIEKLIELADEESVDFNTSADDVESENARALSMNEIKTDIKSETNILADRFSHMSNIFNEQLGNRENDDVSALLKTKPVANLTDAIGLNDKFLFIRELFGGSRTSYDEAIIRLNEVDNIEDAKDIIISFTKKGDDNEIVKQLLDLMKRKLLSDG